MYFCSEWNWAYVYVNFMKGNLMRIAVLIPCAVPLDINNVGSMSQALFAHNNPDYDEKQAGKWQAEQVSHLSLMNFGGRIFIGS